MDFWIRLIYYPFLGYGVGIVFKKAVCTCISTFVSSFFVVTVELVYQIYKKYIPLNEHYTD